MSRSEVMSLDAGLRQSTAEWQSEAETASVRDSASRRTPSGRAVASDHPSLASGYQRRAMSVSASVLCAWCGRAASCVLVVSIACGPHDWLAGTRSGGIRMR